MSEPASPVELTYEPRSNVVVPGARLSLGLLLGINLLNYIDRQVLSAVVPNITHDFFGPNPPEGTLAKMGWLGTAFILSYMVTAPIFGWLADRMSRWVLVGVGVILWSLATAAGGFATGFAMLLISRLFVGVGEAGYGPAAPTIISDYFPVARRGSVLSWFYVAIPVGSALGYVVGGVVAGSQLGWRWAFYIVTIPGIILGIWSLFMRDPARGIADKLHAEHLEKQGVVDPNAQAPEHHGLPKLEDYVNLARIPSYVLNTLAIAAMTFAIGGISFWMPHYLVEARHLPDSCKTIFGGITVIAGLAATLLGGLAGDKLRTHVRGAYFFVSGVGILAACPFIALMLYLPFPSAWAALFVAVFFLFFNTGPSNTALANVVRPNVRASAFAINIFLIHALGDAPAPPLLGMIAGKYSWNATFYVVIAVMALAGVLWLLGMPFLEADTAKVDRPGSTAQKTK